MDGRRFFHTTGKTGKIRFQKVARHGAASHRSMKSNVQTSGSIEDIFQILSKHAPISIA
jgi:hypothetical protein